MYVPSVYPYNCPTIDIPFGIRYVIVVNVNVANLSILFQSRFNVTNLQTIQMVTKVKM